MRLKTNPAVQLTYCLNVHPGAGLEDIHAAVGGPARELGGRVAGGGAFGLGLRISDEAATALTAPGETRRLRDRLEEGGAYAFTVNAFPFAAFHGTRVKTNVYAPDWRDEARLTYTLRVASILADLLPENSDGSISTVPGSFREWIKEDEDIDHMALQLARTAHSLHLLRDRTGRLIHLGLEPEPCCFMETTGEFLSFFKDRVLLQASRQLAYEHGLTRPAAEALLRAHLGLCLDTCHLAIQGEDLADSTRRVLGEGVLISKVQLSAALVCPSAATFRRRMPAFDDGVYLHQTVARGPGGARLAYTDLPQALADLPADATDARVHFHVPMYWGGDGELATTRDALTPAFRDLLLQAASPHLEIETYTFAVMPPDLTAGRDIVDHLEAEWRWVNTWLAG